MQAVTTIGLDIAKSVFQIHGVDAAGNVIVRRQLKRRYVTRRWLRMAAMPSAMRVVIGTSRQFAAPHHLRRFRIETYILRAAFAEPYLLDRVLLACARTIHSSQ